MTSFNSFPRYERSRVNAATIWNEIEIVFSWLSAFHKNQMLLKHIKNIAWYKNVDPNAALKNMIYVVFSEFKLPSLKKESRVEGEKVSQKVFATHRVQQQPDGWSDRVLVVLIFQSSVMCVKRAAHFIQSVQSKKLETMMRMRRIKRGTFSHAVLMTFLKKSMKVCEMCEMKIPFSAFICQLQSFSFFRSKFN